MPDEAVAPLPGPIARDAFSLQVAQFPHRPKILAEGDSWFSYPPDYLVAGEPSNIILWLRRKDAYNLKNMSSTGDEAVAMLASKAKIGLITELRDQHYDALLFSGGGNDIVGEYDMPFFLRIKRAGMTWKDCIREDRFARRLNQIENAYRDLIELTIDYARNRQIPIITHTYDRVVPSPRGAEFIEGLLTVGRSWIYPYMLAADITDSSDQIRIIDYMLSAFQDRLLALQQVYPRRFFVVKTQGTLRPGYDWLNEIHPSPKGFRKLAEKVDAKLTELLGPRPD